MGFCAILLGICGDFAEGGEFQSGQTGSIFVRDGDGEDRQKTQDQRRRTRAGRQEKSPRHLGEEPALGHACEEGTENHLRFRIRQVPPTAGTARNT